MEQKPDSNTVIEGDKAAVEQFDEAAQRRANAFRDLEQKDALQQHPELIGAYVVLEAMAKHAEAHGLSPAQQEVVLARVKNNLTVTISQGTLPEASIKEAQEGVHQDKDKDLAR